MDILTALKESGLQVTGVHGNEAKAHCPFHDDTKASFSINLAKGVWICFGACGKGGTFDTLREYLKLTTPVTFSSGVSKPLGILGIPEMVVKYLASRLHTAPEALEFLRGRHISLKIISQFRLGYDPVGKRISIPIYDLAGKCVNIKLYDFLKISDVKMISYMRGTGTPRLYPISVLREAKTETIFLMEGEPDTLLALSLGLPAVTSTGGAGTWPIWHTEYFRNKNVIVCYDTDIPGQNGARKVLKALTNVAKSVKNIVLPVSDWGKKDFTDYILQGGTKKSFLKICGLEDSE